MATLSQKNAHFNRSFKLSSDSNEFSSDRGAVVFYGIDEKLGFSQTIANHPLLLDEHSF